MVAKCRVIGSNGQAEGGSRGEEVDNVSDGTVCGGYAANDGEELVWW